MKINTTVRIGLGVLAALCLQISGNLYGASYLYQDDFSANAGALNGRANASGSGAWTNADGAFQVGNDKITINANTPDYHTASFSLPSLGASDTLSLSITLRPSGANFIGFGFNPNSASYLTQTGYGWVYFEGLNGGNPNIQIFTGASTGGPLQGTALDRTPLYLSNLNFNASLATTFEYTYSAAAKTLSLSAVNGTSSSTLLNNADVRAIPLSSFSNFSLQFQGQTLGSDSNPAYVDNLSVSIIPEPSTFSMLLCGLGAMTAIYRRRRQTPRL